MAAALDNASEIFLTNTIGFDAAKRNCMTRKGYINADTFVDWRFKNTKKCFDEVSKRRMDAGWCQWGNLFAKKSGILILGRPL